MIINNAILKKASAVATNDTQSTVNQYKNISDVVTAISTELTSTVEGAASDIAGFKDTLGGKLDITITSTTDLDTFDTVSKMTSASEVKFASGIGLTETTLTKLVAGGGVLSTAYKNFKSKTTNIPLSIGTQTLGSENNVTDLNALLGSGGNEGAVTGTLKSGAVNFLTAQQEFKITGSGHKITLNFGSVAADAGADVLTRLDSYIKDSNITVLNGTLTKVTGANAGSIAKDSKSAFNVTLSEDVTVQEGSNVAGATTGTVDYAKGVKDSIGTCNRSKRYICWFKSYYR